MKKFLIIGSITMALIGTVAFAGCGEDPDEGKNDTPATPVFETLSELAAKDYSKITLEVKTAMNGDTLNGTYISEVVSEGYKVTYSYEKFNTIESSGDGYVFPDSAKTTYQGTLTLESADAKLEGAEFTAVVLTASRLNFDKNYFTNVSESSGKVTATVSNASGFFGKTFTATNMTIEVTYTSTKLTKMTLNYTSGSAQITMAYSFN